MTLKQLINLLNFSFFTPDLVPKSKVIITCHLSPPSSLKRFFMKINFTISLSLIRYKSKRLQIECGLTSSSSALPPPSAATSKSKDSLKNPSKTSNYQSAPNNVNIATLQPIQAPFSYNNNIFW